MDAPRITEEWLAECGFKWSQVDRQPSKHWTLWIGAACVDVDSSSANCHDSIGIELSQAATPNIWHCWLRNDIAGRYSRIIHVRMICLQAEVVSIIEALTGRKLDWRDVFYGSLRCPVDAEKLRRDQERFDQRINRAWVDRVDAEPRTWLNV